MNFSRDSKLTFSLQDTDSTVYVYHTLLDEEAFMAVYRLLTKVYQSILKDELDFRTIPAIASIILTDTAKALGIEDIINNDVISEIRRLTNVSLVINGERKHALLADVVKRNLLSKSVLRELESNLIFFTLIAYIVPSQDRQAWIAATSYFWNWVLNLLTLTEWIDSLQK